MTLYRKKFARKKIKVDGATVEVLILGSRAELPIGVDLDEEMDRVSAQLGYWGSVLAAAKKEQIKVDASYRRFRAIANEEILKKDPKLAEWKVKAKIEALDGFSQYKDAIAQAEENVELCAAMVRAFDKKANVLQSKGAHVRDVIKSQGKYTASKPRGWNLSGQGSDKDDEAPDERNGAKKKKKKGKKRRSTNG